MLHVVLFRPEIPPNTGNIMRLCANTGTSLHLIHPLGFSLDDQLLRRAGLDYREWADVEEHESFERFLSESSPSRVVAFTRNATASHASLEYEAGDTLLFGPESDGLPEDVLGHAGIAEQVRIPMVPRSRSLNLSNAVAIALYEGLRQRGFPGLTTEGK
ncbi:MAG: tRNA (uridine(34)/cytosine(34)/5-carboxymethylaminomethyluridine(34)-2'-O)-methyltransferase TrmL [Acidimicrobiia bacterium]